MASEFTVQYLTDEQGKRQAAVVPIRTWKSLLEDLELLRRKAEVLTGLKQACDEAKLQDECQLPEQYLEDFLDEL